MSFNGNRIGRRASAFELTNIAYPGGLPLGCHTSSRKAASTSAVPASSDHLVEDFLRRAERDFVATVRVLDRQVKCGGVYGGPLPPINFSTSLRRSADLEHLRHDCQALAALDHPHRLELELQRVPRPR